MKLTYTTSDEIRKRIGKIGRTEDVNISPDNHSFILADFLDDKLHQFSYRLRNGNDHRIEITNYCQITSAAIKKPHGVCFLDNHRIVVCNRSGGVSIFSLPNIDDEICTLNLEPEKVISGDGLLTAKVTTPGSVHPLQISENSYRIFICNNHRHTITSHDIELNDRIKVANNGILIENSLRFPDGISISPDGRWIAISNHDYGQVALYENNSSLNKHTPPSETLDGPVCPHGICFNSDDGKLVVTDAATQYIYIYESENGNWGKVIRSPRAVKLLDDDTFYYGKTGLKDGGVKGIAIDKSNSILITTHRMEVLGFYNLEKINKVRHEPEKKVITEYSRLRDETLKKTNRSLLFKYWPQGIPLVQAIRNNKYLKPSYYKSEVQNTFILGRLKFNNRWSGETLTDSSGPVLSLTSHGKRLETVFYTIESIRRGDVKPSRVILWLDNEDKNNLPDTLKRLQKAGLEIYYSKNIGPHKKYYHYLQENEDFNKPLVTADDDVIYPPDWLKGLVDAYRSNPSVIHSYRTYRMRLFDGKFIPFKDWRKRGSQTPSHLNFISGVSGVIYPPEFLEYLKDVGDGFLSTCPTSDDIWLTVHALRSGFKIAQVDTHPKTFKTIPGSQVIGLHHKNVFKDGNHFQLLDTFTDEDMQKLTALLNEKKNGVEV